MSGPDTACEAYSTHDPCPAYWIRPQTSVQAYIIRAHRSWKFGSRRAAAVLIAIARSCQISEPMESPVGWMAWLCGLGLSTTGVGGLIMDPFSCSLLTGPLWSSQDKKLLPSTGASVAYSK